MLLKLRRVEWKVLLQLRLKKLRDEELPHVGRLIIDLMEWLMKAAMIMGRVLNRGAILEVIMMLLLVLTPEEKR